MLLVRRLLVVVFAVGVAQVPAPSTAIACSCLTDPVVAAEEYDLEPDVVFVGTAIDRGPTDIGSEFSEPGEPGEALLFDVHAVRLGDIGSSVVMYAPGGGGSGNCSIGAIDGPQLVWMSRDLEGALRGGLCSLVPVSGAPSSESLTDTFGPERSPDPAIEPEALPVDDIEEASDDSGPPVVLVVVIALVAVLVAGGVFLARRGRRTGHPTGSD